jgi:serine/threonine-protein kinase
MTTIRLPRGQWSFDEGSRLGAAGGFGEVFAGSGPDGAPIAVKRLHLTADQAAHRELRIADHLITRTLTHVIPILDAGQDAESDRYFVVMARAEKSLQQAVGPTGLPQADAVRILLDICHGLQQASEIVHRDLKPANVLLHDGTW